MTKILANIGTSDLAVKLEGLSYYLPIFEREEPTEKESQEDLTEEEQELWKERNEYAEWLLSELDVPFTKKGAWLDFSFREVTRKLLEAYQTDEDSWHDRIRPGRISGVFEFAQNNPSFEVSTAYIFVTDQPEYILDEKTGQEKPNRGYLSDSIHLFGIIQKWFQREMPDVKIIPKVIDKNIPAVDTDQLLNYYYQFLRTEIQPNDTILISLKGGTPQMRTALTMQAIASSVTKQLFIDPKLSRKKLLAGEASECDFNSYWRYMRSQKYQDVKIILESRWDFKGSIQLIEDWQKTLKFVNKYIDDRSLSENMKLLNRIVETLAIADWCFNSDIQSAKDWVKNNPQLANELDRNLVGEVSTYDRLLNLYTQCRIYYDELDQAANFISRIGSFYDLVLEQVAWKFQCNRDFPNRDNRFEKRKFLDGKVRSRNSSDKQGWEQVEENLRCLDGWYDRRSYLLHSADGVSKERMRELYKTMKKETAHPDAILDVMAEILNSPLGIIRQDYRKYVGKTAKYYIYSAAKEWAITALISEGSA